MGLRRRELALGSAVRRLRGPTGLPGTAPVPAAADPAHAILTIMAAALERRKQNRPSRERKLDGRAEVAASIPADD